MKIQIANPHPIYYLNSNSETEFKMHSQYSCKLCPGAWNTQDLQMHVCLQYIITTSVIMTLETYFSLQYQTVVWTYGSRICHSAFRTVGAKYACLDLNTFLWSFITFNYRRWPSSGLYEIWPNLELLVQWHWHIWAILDQVFSYRARFFLPKMRRSASFYSSTVLHSAYFSLYKSSLNRYTCNTNSSASSMRGWSVS